MSNLDFAAAIDDLLRRPLFAFHLKQLMALKEKNKHGELSEVDRIYITDTWNQFRSLRPLWQGDDSPEKKAKENGEAIHNPLEMELKKANETIDRLRDAAKRILAQRDEWRSRAEELSKQLDGLSRPHSGVDQRFDQAKRTFAKLYHPNAQGGRSQLDVMVRTEVFKEFWSELERIESEG